MALDLKAKALLTAIAAAEEPALGSVPIHIARRSIESRYEKLSLPRKEIGSVTNIEIEGSEAKIPLRIYRPAGAGPFPVILFFHGGGWVLFTPENYDPISTHLCHDTHAIVVSVDYRRSPENKFPASLNDCYDAVCWADAHIGEYGGDTSRIALAGDSAGGNLVAATTFRLRDEGGPACCGQVLLYPVTDYYTKERQSYREFAEGFGLTFRDMEWFWAQYLQNPADSANPMVCPLLAPDLSGLPDAFVVVAGNDLLRDEGIEYAQRLRDAGVPTHLSVYEEMIHGFISYLGILGHARTALTETARWLNQRFDSHVHIRFRSP